MNKQIFVCAICCSMYHHSLLSVAPAVILRNLGCDKTEASNLGLLPLVQSIDILPPTTRFEQFQRSNATVIGGILDSLGRRDEHLAIDYQFILPVLKLVYARAKATDAAHADAISEIKKLQASIDASNKQNAVQMKGLEQRLDSLILCNTKLMEFLAQKDHTITSTQDVLTLVDKSKQLLEEELMSKNERIASLENAFEALKAKMEDLTVENESIRAELEASIQGLQLKPKQ